MRPLLAFFLALVPVYGGTLVSTSVIFQPFSGPSTVVDSCSGTDYCLSTGTASVARATTGPEVLSDGEIGYGAHAYALADVPYMVSDASAIYDAWLTFSGNVLYSIEPDAAYIDPGVYQPATITVNAPRYTADLTAVYLYARRAWIIQPGVPVHVVINASSRAEGPNGTSNSFAILSDTTIQLPIPEPSTFGLLGAGILLLQIARYLHRTLPMLSRSACAREEAAAKGHTEPFGWCSAARFQTTKYCIVQTRLQGLWNFGSGGDPNLASGMFPGSI